jgi:signal transduction histidine kinase
MIQQFLNWRTALAAVAICIVSGTIIYSNLLAQKIRSDELRKVTLYRESRSALMQTEDQQTLNLSTYIARSNTDIPIILTDDRDSILDHINIDTLLVQQDKNYLQKKLSEYKRTNPPVNWTSPLDSSQIVRFYYGDTALLKQVRYYPIVQLLIVAIFIYLTINFISTRNKSTQNQVWAGMAKETAHQLGTPLSSLQGWVEMLREDEKNEKIAAELEKDVNRLKLVSDRFSKIGSTPQLEPHYIAEQISNMVEYMRKRAAGKVQLVFNAGGHEQLQAMISGPLFDWVIENLLKNALDSMEGRGSIKIDLQETAENILIDVTDTGKGISRQNVAKVFKPGFTTKKRGWGLGLSLSKRIIEQYHKGQLFVKQSELGKGTTFRIVLHK